MLYLFFAADAPLDIFFQKTEETFQLLSDTPTAIATLLDSTDPEDARRFRKINKAVREIVPAAEKILEQQPQDEKILDSLLRFLKPLESQPMFYKEFINLAHLIISKFPNAESKVIQNRDHFFRNMTQLLENNVAHRDKPDEDAKTNYLCVPDLGEFIHRYFRDETPQISHLLFQNFNIVQKFYEYMLKPEFVDLLLEQLSEEDSQKVIAWLFEYINGSSCNHNIWMPFALTKFPDRKTDISAILKRHIEQNSDFILYRGIGDFIREHFFDDDYFKDNFDNLLVAAQENMGTISPYISTYHPGIYDRIIRIFINRSTESDGFQSSQNLEAMLFAICLHLKPPSPDKDSLFLEYLSRLLDQIGGFRFENFNLNEASPIREVLQKVLEPKPHFHEDYRRIYSNFFESIVPQYEALKNIIQAFFQQDQAPALPAEAPAGMPHDPYIMTSREESLEYPIPEEVPPEE